MFRSLALIAMRQEQHEARHAEPLPLAGGDELIDDDLRAVRKVAELRLPKHKRVRLGEAVAVFESEHGLLGQARVDDLELGLIPGDMLKRRVFLLVLLIHQYRMALREGAALRILVRQ